MAIIQAKSGQSVLLGGGSRGYQVIQPAAPAGITIADPGIPIRDYPAPVDPLTIWKTQPSVRKVVSFAAAHFAVIPWHAYRRKDDSDRERVAASPAERIFEDPGGDGLFPGVSFWQFTIIDRLLYDMQLAIYTESDGLVRIPPSLVRIASDRWGRPREIYLRMPAGEDDLNVTGLPKIFTYGWAADQAGGVSPMRTLSAILEENSRAVQWRRDQWSNAPKISGILKRPEGARPWKKEHRERFESQWSAWKESPKAGGTPILDDGMEYQQLQGISPKDANDIEGRRLTDEEVASAFHIPPELVGAREGNYSNIEAFREMLYGPTIGPLFGLMTQAVKIGGLIPTLDPTPGLYVEPNREAGMAGSFWEQVKYLQAAIGGPFMTRAEGRARMNMPYIEGTEELITHLNVTVGGQASPQDSGSQNIGGDNADPDAREDQL